MLGGKRTADEAAGIGMRRPAPETKHGKGVLAGARPVSGAAPVEDELERSPEGGPLSGGTHRAGGTPRLAKRLLLLGGTREAVDLARALDGDPRVETTYSLAGRTRRPVPVPGAVRTGGFGGPSGLEGYLREAGIGLVVDATHPYAEAISAHAAVACEGALVPRLVLHRPPWAREPEDRWVEVADSASAARALPALGERVLLTVGSRGLRPFLHVPGVSFIVRAVEPPAVALDAARFEVVLARGPFDFDSERRLLESRAIDVVVSKNSGGAGSHAKLEAARALGLPVVMIVRPLPPPGERAGSVAAARAWIAAWIEARLPAR